MTAIFPGAEVAGLLRDCGITHVVTVPDSTLGQWEPDIEAIGIRLVRVCREGEAWAVAAGLYLGGARPLVMMQCTGLFESGDSLRDVLHDWQLPIPSIIGYRSYLSQETLPGDTCLTFTEPILRAWQIDYCLVTESAHFDLMAGQIRTSLAEGKARAVLLAEGKA